MSAFLNGKFLGSGQGSSWSWTGVDVQNGSYSFTPDMLKSENGLSILCYHPAILT